MSIEQFPQTALEHPLHWFKHTWQVDPKHEEHGWREAMTEGFNAPAVDENLTHDTHMGSVLFIFWAAEKSMLNMADEFESGLLLEIGLKNIFNFCNSDELLFSLCCSIEFSL